MKPNSIAIHKTFFNYTLCKRTCFTKAFKELLSNPDDFLANSQGPVFKCLNNDTTTVAVVEIDRRKFVVKRYNIKGLGHWLKKFWRKSRAMHAWQHAHYLQALQIPTLTPLAVIEKRFGILRGRSYFIYEYVEGIKGSDYFSAEAKIIPAWGQVIKNFVDMLRLMHKGGIIHNDLQCGNLLIVGTNPLLLDLDHVRIYRHHGKKFIREARRDLQHFLDFLASNKTAQKLFQEACMGVSAINL